MIVGICFIIHVHLGVTLSISTSNNLHISRHKFRAPTASSSYSVWSPALWSTHIVIYRKPESKPHKATLPLKELLRLEKPQLLTTAPILPPANPHTAGNQIFNLLFLTSEPIKGNQSKPAYQLPGHEGTVYPRQIPTSQLSTKVR